MMGGSWCTWKVVYILGLFGQILFFVAFLRVSRGVENDVRNVSRNVSRCVELMLAVLTVLAVVLK